MSDDADTLNRERAREIVQQVGKATPMSDADQQVLVNAIETDLGTAATEAVHDKERLSKVEAQVKVLSDAVIVIGAPSVAVDDAVKAVKDEL